MNYKKIMILGSGELGRELCISLKRLGCHVIAVDNYEKAPAMQLADQYEVINMLDGNKLELIIKKHNPDLIVPEIEAIRTEKLIELEMQGHNIIPNAQAVYLTMNRIAIREKAAKECQLLTARYAYAENLEELKKHILNIVGIPCVVKPIMSSSGKGQSTVKNETEIEKVWEYACQNMRGDQKKVIAEEFIPFDYEITLLTIRQKYGPTLFCPPIGHRQESGDYRESWQPANMSEKAFQSACHMAQKITDALGGVGLFGVEFFVKGDVVIFSELSPRPHDTGMVTLMGQNLSEFDLHARAILELPIPEITLTYPASASAVILADRDADTFSYSGLEDALKEKNSDLRLFSKPKTRRNRRMGVALACGQSIAEAIEFAKKSASSVKINYGET
ncbi:MAG: phosphoribosylglycinamide formyltransferase 2 [Bdellovibrio sp. CG12_big_fil_rev_8_21_14_0_65_39_13]|nr:MAG: phosphoribosylglycinamide formyltransferase 2 [Bdellovibrio sp. CG22_combo_CG10-13_8_21_14_all_39_27]PIQ62913.1 MAG: phosphoribosylglycinamide formyltransferase 2 [Bdellovibrio sp. CG12_big_fil_rev_8_21_14_0_65_39_13]PIR33268.1 MAG: phosphoribosylglycinamide formyltransferase 2 [Bdellovibrio sp. CG11_big_fil_rev_8_21_14_0_20_39_38]PJB54593.1 MAG: phosphoribosylglycinamide formyltransferase 2 [Bdellovibrio sp. CG_4_9_14_3_um_filter_39_7]